MTTFNDREKSFENKYAHDEELRFKATARRNKLLGLWAAGQFGLTGEEAEAYAREVVKADFEETGHQDVIRKLKQDFDACDIEMSEHRLERHLEDCMDEAKRQLLNEVS